MKILVLPGDGIGPEISSATLAVLGALDSLMGLGLTFETMDIGLASLRREGSTLPGAVIDRVPEVDGVILGPVSHYDYPPADQGGINPSARLRVAFELGANIRPCRSYPGLTLLQKPMDLVIVRECTEGFYADRNMFSGPAEFMPDAHTAFAIRKISSKACERVAHAAFGLARIRRGKVTAVHKANVLKLSDGLFLREVRRIAAQYPDVELEELIVDAAAALLIRSPERFDVIVTTNMFGDILSDEASELCGSLGLGASINAGDSICVAQAQHGSAPDIAGLNIANPTSLILSAAMLLRWRGERDQNSKLVEGAQLIESAVRDVLADSSLRTQDIGGARTTSEFAQSVIDAINERGAGRANDAARDTFQDSLRAAPTRPEIFHSAEIPAVDRGGGVRTIPLLTRQTGATSFINGITIFAGGGSVPLHKHNCDESVLVLGGHAIAEIAGEQHEVGEGDVTFIPEGVHHCFRNRSLTAEMRILWTYASLDADRTIIATGETRRIDDEHMAGAG